jgi:DNA-directed RNA polymerase subunit RPC12/RpoP
MTDTEKTLVQNWAYWLEHHCGWECDKQQPLEGSGCKGCSIRNIVKQMKEEAEK